MKKLTILLVLATLLFTSIASAHEIINITASSVQVWDTGVSFPAEYAIDNNSGTRWSSEFSDPQFLVLDLGSEKEISSIIINWEGAYASVFEIQTSNDNQTWETFYTENHGTGGVDTISLNNTARYVRIYLIERETQWGYSIIDLRIE